MLLELERAERVRDVLDRIRRRMREVVHRIDAPGIAGPVVMGPPDAVEDRIAHDDVGRRHVDPGPEHMRTVLELAGAHAREQVEAFLDWPVAERAVAASLGQRAAVLADFLGAEAVDIRLAGHDEVDGVAVERLEVVRGVKRLIMPVEAQPADVLLDRLDVLDVLFRGVRVVEAQVAGAAELGRHAEIQANRLGVADVQVAVRLGGEPRGHTSGMLPRADVLSHDGPDEIERGVCLAHGSCNRVAAHKGKPLF